MHAPQNVFVFAPMFNQPPDTANPFGNDSAGVFQPGARRFGAFWAAKDAKVTTLLFNNHAGEKQRLNEITHALSVAPSMIDAIAYFGHGEKDMLASALIGPGFLPDFIQALRACCAFVPTVVLYACSCGAPKGIASGIAEGLSDLLPAVYGHASPGHAYLNPQVRVHPTGGRACPDGKAKPWTAAFTEASDFWMRFPFMTSEEIAAELR